MNTCLEASSPRISYSLDFIQLDGITVEPTLPSLHPSLNPGFEFGPRGSFEFEHSSAYELFENGMILPNLYHKKQASHCEEAHELEKRPKPIPFLSPLHLNHEEAEVSPTNAKADEKIQQKFSWGVRRSSSLDSETSSKMSFLFPLPALYRSKSVSSAVSRQKDPKHRPVSGHKQQPPVWGFTKSPSSGNACSSFPSRHCPPSLRKSRTYHGNNMRVSPVLNVPQYRCSAGGMSLFGLGCLPIRGKEKKSRR